VNFKTKYEAVRQRLVGSNAQFKNVELLSYHLPKTAGTSLYLSLEEAYGAERIKRVYEPKDHQPLTSGEPFWVSSSTRVLHGHFRPHPMHVIQFPNAKRIIWVRDPIERCWSLLRHWLKLENGKRYQIFKAKHIKTGNETPEELFDCLVNDPEFVSLRLIYQTFMQNVEANHFHFVGKAEDFDNELKRLSDIVGKDLKSHAANVNQINKDLPFKKADYFSHFESDYRFLEDRFDIVFTL